MDIKRTQNVNFTGTVILKKQALAENPLLRPLIKHLKNHCGGKDITHIIKADELCLSVMSSYKPQKPVNGHYKFLKSFDIVSCESDPSITKKNVNQMIDWSKEIPSWAKNIKNMERAQAKMSSPKNTKSIFQKFLSIFQK